MSVFLLPPRVGWDVDSFLMVVNVSFDGMDLRAGRAL